jgi:hypothetical protein
MQIRRIQADLWDIKGDLIIGVLLLPVALTFQQFAESLVAQAAGPGGLFTPIVMLLCLLCYVVVGIVILSAGILQFALIDDLYKRIVIVLSTAIFVCAVIFVGALSRSGPITERIADVRVAGMFVLLPTYWVAAISDWRETHLGTWWRAIFVGALGSACLFLSLGIS